MGQFNFQFVLTIISLLIIAVGFQNCGRNAQFSELAQKLVAENSPSTNDENGKENNDSTDDNDDASNTLLCNDFLGHKEAEVAESAGVYSNIRTNLILIATDDIDVISNVDGNVKIYAETPISIGAIRNIDGNVILCGAMAITVNNIDGNLKVFGADLGDVNGVDGNVEITAGQFLGAMTNIDGNIRNRDID